MVSRGGPERSARRDLREPGTHTFARRVS
jgi:hypothetical protein